MADGGAVSGAAPQAAPHSIERFAPGHDFAPAVGAILADLANAG